MNESAGSKSTVATIGGAKETLVFGDRYNVRHGDDAVLRSVVLRERFANGDLSFEDGDGSTYRVRPSRIDTIVPIGTESTASVISERRDDETARGYLARIERGLGSGQYARWIGTDPGQAALAAAAKEDQAARNGKVSKRPGGPATVGEILSDLDASGAFPRFDGTPKLTTAGKKKLVAAGADPELVEKATTAEEAGVPVHAEPGSLAARILDAGKPKGRPYAERNQVWKCGECKRRTRQPVCENGHAPVAAPAGKRREDRGSK